MHSIEDDHGTATGGLQWVATEAARGGLQRAAFLLASLPQMSPSIYRKKTPGGQ